MTRDCVTPAKTLGQKSFWRFMGLFTLVILVVYAVVLVAAVIFGVVGWRMMR